MRGGITPAAGSGGGPARPGGTRTLEPRVRLELVDALAAEPELGVTDEAHLDEVARLRAHARQVLRVSELCRRRLALLRIDEDAADLREVRVALWRDEGAHADDGLEVRRVGLVRTLAQHELEGRDAERVEVRDVAVLVPRHEDLRGHVRSARGGGGRRCALAARPPAAARAPPRPARRRARPVGRLAGHAEVRDFELPIRVQQQVLRLDVPACAHARTRGARRGHVSMHSSLPAGGVRAPVEDAGSVHVLEAEDDLRNVDARLLFREALVRLLRELEMEVTSQAQIHDNVEVSICHTRGQRDVNINVRYVRIRESTSSDPPSWNE